MDVFMFQGGIFTAGKYICSKHVIIISHFIHCNLLAYFSHTPMLCVFCVFFLRGYMRLIVYHRIRVVNLIVILEYLLDEARHHHHHRAVPIISGSNQALFSVLDIHYNAMFRRGKHMYLQKIWGCR